MAVFLAIPAAHAQDAATPDTAGVPLTSGARRSSLIPFPILFYQPETGTGFGASVSWLFTLSGSAPADSAAPTFRSSLGMTAIYTSKEQTIVGLGTELYPGGGRYRVEANVGYTEFPNTFWGVGNDTPESLEEDYTPRMASVSGEFQTQVARALFAGGFGELGRRELREVQPDGLIATGAVPGVEDGSLLTAGVLLTRDTRSHNVYPRSGVYQQFRASHSFDLSEHGNDYGTWSLDLRRYLSLGTGVVAGRALGIATTDTPPFDLMPQLGGQDLLRGHFAGRYRDRSLAALEAEYRSPMWWRVGAVLFAGAGQVAHAPGDLRMDAFHSSAGAGLRFLVNRREQYQIRADFGLGLDQETTGFYLGFGQAF
jgi:outer membrane protein assembly factor BamA